MMTDCYWYVRSRQEQRIRIKCTNASPSYATPSTTAYNHHPSGVAELFPSLMRDFSTIINKKRELSNCRDPLKEKDLPSATTASACEYNRRFSDVSLSEEHVASVPSNGSPRYVRTYCRAWLLHVE
jgi:hypothetical protein